MAERASTLATWLDWLMLLERGVAISSAGIPIERLPLKTGVEVFAELGGRFLIRYLVPAQVGRFSQGDPGRHYTTPTAYTPTEALALLAPPGSTEPRAHALLLDPRRIPRIRGPQWVASPGGIQYVLIDGFPQDAIVVPGAPGAHWE